MAVINFIVDISLSIWNPLFYKEPSLLISPTSTFFQILSNHPFPIASNHHSHCSFSCLVSLDEWVIAPDLTIILLYDFMDLNMSSLGTCAPEGPYYVFYVTRSQVYWDLAFMWFFAGTLIWSRTYTNTHKDTKHIQGLID